MGEHVVVLAYRASQTVTRDRERSGAQQFLTTGAVNTQARWTVEGVVRRIGAA
jgi:hypothetical protein